MATLIRSCEEGHTPRNRPDSAAPIAGVYREVRPRLIRGLRRRNARADGSSNEARRRRKKRCNRRWNSKIKDNEADRRTLEALGFWFLFAVSLSKCLSRVYNSCHNMGTFLRGYSQSARNHLPPLKSEIGRHEDTQTGSHS